MREIEALGAELKRSHDELDKSRADVSPHSCDAAACCERGDSSETFLSASLHSPNQLYDFMCLCFCLGHVQTARLQRELRHSETTRVEAERKAAKATDELTRLTDVSHQMEEISRENDLLTSRVLVGYSFTYMCNIQYA